MRVPLLAGSRLHVVLRNPAEESAAAARSAGATETRLAGNVLTVSCPPDRCLHVLGAIERAGSEIDHFSTEEPSLEEVYLRYVNGKNSDSGGAGDGGVRNPSAPSR